MQPSPREDSGARVETCLCVLSQANTSRFPLGDSIGQHGVDGDLETAIGFDPFVPEGESLWKSEPMLMRKQKRTVTIKIDSQYAGRRAGIYLCFCYAVIGTAY